MEDSLFHMLEEQSVLSFTIWICEGEKKYYSRGLEFKK